MSALDSDFAFSRGSRRFGYGENLDSEDFTDDEPVRGSGVVGGFAAFSIFAGLGIMSAMIFTTGYLALLSDTPAIWIHRLMAMTLAQSILISAIAMKLLPRVEWRRNAIGVAADTSVERLVLPEQSDESEESEEDAAAPPSPSLAVAGKLAGRDYLAHPDGTIEIDTLVGRRRFVSIEAAKEFVGA
jgi:hypothetical protein